MDFGIPHRQVSNRSGGDPVGIGSPVGGVERVMDQAILDQDARGAARNIDQILRRPSDFRVSDRQVAGTRGRPDCVGVPVLAVNHQSFHGEIGVVHCEHSPGSRHQDRPAFADRAKANRRLRSAMADRVNTFPVGSRPQRDGVTRPRNVEGVLNAAKRIGFGSRAAAGGRDEPLGRLPRDGQQQAHASCANRVSDEWNRLHRVTLTPTPPAGAPRLHYGCLSDSRKIHLNQSVKRRGAAALAGLLLALAFGAGPVLVARLPLAHADAIVSLASHEWERLPAAARLAREHPRAMVILTIPERVTPYNCHDCANRTDRLRRLGVDGARVRELQLTAPGTYGEALAVRAFAEKTGIRTLIVATSPYHTRRSLAAFRKVFHGTGIQVGVEPASATSPARPAWWWIAGYDRAYVAYEWAAMAYYTWKYGIDPIGPSP